MGVKETKVTKPELLKLFEQAADDAMRGETYGTMEVTFKAGVPEILRTEKTVKLNGGNGKAVPNQTVTNPITLDQVLSILPKPQGGKYQCPACDRWAMTASEKNGKVLRKLFQLFARFGCCMESHQRETRSGEAQTVHST